MSEITNYIPINRKIFEHRFWCEDREYSRFEAWIDLIQSARFEDGKKYIGNKVLLLKRGQLHASYRFLAERWHWSLKRVQGYIDLLLSDEMITKDTHKDTGHTVITICNYDAYNPSSKKGIHLGYTSDTPRIHLGYETNNDNNEKNVNKKIISPAVAEAPSEDSSFAVKAKFFIDEFNRIKGGSGKPCQYLLTTKVKDKLRARIRDGYTSKQIFTALRKAMSEQHHKDNGLKWITPEFILRSDKLEAYLHADETSRISIKLTNAQKRRLQAI